MINENTAINLSKRLGNFYQDISESIFREITRLVTKDMADPNYETIKMKEKVVIQRELLSMVNDINDEMPSLVNSTVESSVEEGNNTINRELIALGVARAIFKEVNGINQKFLMFLKPLGFMQEGDVVPYYVPLGDRYKIEAIQQALNDELTSVSPQIFQSSLNAYTRIISESTTQLVERNITLEQSVQLSLNRFADIGITGFVDRAGRRWNLESYVENITRTAYVRANVVGVQNRMQELGHNLVICSYHAGSSDLCIPFENKVLIVDE